MSDPIHNLKHASEKKSGKCGGKERKHPYLVTVLGECAGCVDGCKAKFHAGMTEDDLGDLASGKNEFVPFHLHITGEPCVHIWKKVYSRCTGKARADQVNHIVDGSDKGFGPTIGERIRISSMSMRPNFQLGIMATLQQR